MLWINEYVGLEFVPVVKANDVYEDERGTKENEALYIIKVFVKIGYPKHYYHVINNEHSIDFYVRLDRNVEKKPFPDAHSVIYDRLDKFD